MVKDKILNLTSKRKPVVISFLNQKGGVGKTTTAIHAFIWFNRFCNVGFIDADAQRSSSSWIQSMNGGWEVEVLCDAHKLLQQIPDIKKRYDLLIIDSPGSMADVSRSILSRSDVVIVPCQSSYLDLESTHFTLEMIEYIQDIRSGALEALLFINKAEPKTTLFRESQKAIWEISGKPNMRGLKSYVSKRQPIMDAPGQDQTVFSFGSQNLSSSNKLAVEKAVREYNQLFTEILGVINNG